MLVQTDLWGDDVIVGAPKSASKFQLKKLSAANLVQDNFKVLTGDKITEFQELIDILREDPIFWIDTETNGLNWWQHKICGISITLYDPEHTSYYIPIRHSGAGSKNFDPEYVFEQLKPILEDTGTLKVFHNAKFDCHFFQNEGIEVKNFDDTMLLAHLIDENYSKKLDLLAKRYLGAQKIELPENSDYSTFPISLLGPYACKDTELTKKLWDFLNERFDKQYGADYREFPLAVQEREILRILMESERTGIRIDLPYMREVGTHLEKDIEKLQEKVESIAPGLNVRSPKQLVKYFLDAGVKLTDKTEKGAFQMGKKQLEKIDHPLSETIIELGKKSKLKSTFVDNMLNHLASGDRLHCNFLTTGTKIGRKSSSRPNLQNIPREDTAGEFSIRRGFITDPDFHLVAIDYSQMELRILAHYSEDPKLVRTFKENLDPHKITATLIFEKIEDDITGTERTIAKTINFGIIYGMGPKLLSVQIKIPYRDAMKFINKFRDGYAAVKDLEDSIKSVLYGRGYIFNQYKRRRHIDNPKIFYRGLHSLISGCCADMLKEKMILIDQYIKEHRLKSRMVLFVHDEIVFLMHRDELDHVEVFKSIMEPFDWCKIPMPVEASDPCENWAETK